MKNWKAGVCALLLATVAVHAEAYVAEPGWNEVYSDDNAKWEVLTSAITVSGDTIHFWAKKWLEGDAARRVFNPQAFPQPATGFMYKITAQCGGKSITLEQKMSFNDRGNVVAGGAAPVTVDVTPENHYALLVSNTCNLVHTTN